MNVVYLKLLNDAVQIIKTAKTVKLVTRQTPSIVK